MGLEINKTKPGRCDLAIWYGCQHIQAANQQSLMVITLYKQLLWASNYFVQVITLCQWLLCASNYCTKLKMMKKRNLVTYTLMQILASEENVKQRYP